MRRPNASPFALKTPLRVFFWPTPPRSRRSRRTCPCAVLSPGDLRDTSDTSEIDARRLGARPDQPAYMIYTSGSTGTPKGIVITGRNICHYLRSANEVYGLKASDVVFQGASVAFDLSMEEIWVPYLVGASLFVATPKIMGETDNLPGVMDAAGVTVLDTVPTLLAMLPRDIAFAAHHHPGGRSLPARRRLALVQAGPQDLQQLRADRNDGRRNHQRSASRRAGDDRRTDPELHLLCRR